MSNFSYTSNDDTFSTFLHKDPLSFSNNSFIYASLTALRLQFFKLLNVKLELSFSDYIKSQWKVNKETTYPRGYISLASFDILKDRINARTMRGSGIHERERTVEKTGNYLKQAKVFPVKLAMELHYFESDMDRAIFFTENLAVLMAMGGFTFTVTVQDAFEHQIRLIFDDSISIPQLLLQNDTDPGSIEIVSNFSIDTYVGKIDVTPRAYSLSNSETHSKPNIKV